MINGLVWECLGDSIHWREDEISYNSENEMIINSVLFSVFSNADGLLYGPPGHSPRLLKNWEFAA